MDAMRCCCCKANANVVLGLLHNESKYMYFEVILNLLRSTQAKDGLALPGSYTMLTCKGGDRNILTDGDSC